MEAQYYPITTSGIRETVCKIVQSVELPFEVTIQPFKSKRSSAQNRLYWKWLSEISAQYLVDGKRLAKEEWHHLCAMKFIGIKTIEIGNKTFPMPSKSTTKLTIGEFAEYLTQIEAEFLPKGVALTFTDDYSIAMGVE